LQRGEERLLAAAPDGAAARESAPPRDDTVVLAALGWIAVRRNVETWLARCAAGAEMQDTAPASPPAPHGAGLLR
jgi:hypothetical protein